MSTPCMLPPLSRASLSPHHGANAPGTLRPIASSLVSAAEDLDDHGAIATTDLLSLPSAPTSSSVKQALDHPNGASVRLAMRLAVAFGPTAGPRPMAEALAHEWAVAPDALVALFEAMGRVDVKPLETAWCRLTALDTWDEARRRDALLFAPIFATPAVALRVAELFCEGATAEGLAQAIERLMSLAADWRRGPAPQQALACDAPLDRLASELSRRPLPPGLRKSASATFVRAVLLDEARAARALFDALDLSSCPWVSDEIMPNGQLHRLTLGGYELAARIGHTAAVDRLKPRMATRWPAMVAALRNGHDACAIRVCEHAQLDPSEDPLVWREGIGRLMRLRDPDYRDTPALRASIARLTLRIDAWANATPIEKRS